MALIAVLLPVGGGVGVVVWYGESRGSPVALRFETALEPRGCARARARPQGLSQRVHQPREGERSSACGVAAAGVSPADSESAGRDASKPVLVFDHSVGFLRMLTFLAIDAPTFEVLCSREAVGWALRDLLAMLRGMSGRRTMSVLWAPPFTARIAALVFATSLGGCAQQLLDDDRLRWTTAGVLGLPSAQVSIGDRRDVFEGTHYVATTRTGVRYRCFIPGGGLLSAGFVDKPRCQRE